MSHTILLADDDAAIRMVLNQALTRAGYDVRPTGNLSTMWNWVSRGEGDLLITDVAMPGTITYVAPALDERSRSLPVRVTLQAPDGRLRSGLFGSIELVGGGAGERVLVVPADAVATLDGQSVVFVPADEPNSFTPRPIALGRRAGGFFEVRSGLEEGGLLAVSGAFTLKSALRSGELSEGHEH